MFKLLFKSSVSACFELSNDLIYYSGEPYNVIVNGEKLSKKFDTNVFSVFNLKPDTKYTVSIEGSDFNVKFSTDDETCAISVKDFGAVGDGQANDTRAIQTAINCCAKNGRVYVPEGTYFTAPIVLKSNITLDLAAGAKLLASPNVEDYPIVPGEIENVTDGEKFQCATWEGDPRQCYQPFISAYHAENIKIVGEGIIDGNGPNGIWYINHKTQVIGRPRLVFLNNCDNVTLHGINGCNSASWQMHPYFSSNINYYDIKINAPTKFDSDKDSPNTDGCNPESCKNVNIIGVVFSVGDDCIAIKSGKIYMGAKYKRPSENLVIRNCLMRFGHGGVVIGSEIAAGIKNLNVERCLFKHTDRGLRIKVCRGRGKQCVIDDIKFKNVKMDNVLAPLVINMFYHCDPDGKREYIWTKEKLPVDDRTPYIGKVHFKDIECLNYEYSAGFFYGLPEQTIKEVTLENVTFTAKADAGAGLPAMMCHEEPRSKEGLYFNNVDNVSLKNVVIKGIDGDEMQINNVSNIKRK